MVSFGNSSGALNPIDVKKYIAAKSLFFTRPGLTNYVYLKEVNLKKGQASLFEKIKFGKVKIKIFKEYTLSDAKKPMKI